MSHSVPQTSNEPSTSLSFLLLMLDSVRFTPILDLASFSILVLIWGEDKNHRLRPPPSRTRSQSRARRTTAIDGQVN